MSLLLRAIAGDLVEPIHDLAVATMLLDQVAETIAASARAFATDDVHGIELAD